MIIKLTSTNNTPVFVETGDILVVRATPKSSRAAIVVVKDGVWDELKVKETPEEVNALMTPVTTFAKTVLDRVRTGLNNWIGALNKGPEPPTK